LPAIAAAMVAAQTRAAAASARCAMTTEANAAGADRQVIDGSNYLADLAARIRAEHEATATALRRGVEHAMAAGDLLIEAKAQLKHGQWLPWLVEHCAMSERTAQLYIRTAKHRATIEAKIRNGVADLTLNQAAALLVLTSNIDKLLTFAKQLENAVDADDFVSCASKMTSVLLSTPATIALPIATTPASAIGTCSSCSSCANGHGTSTALPRMSIIYVRNSSSRRAIGSATIHTTACKAV
jgi:hypothetical protein